MRTIHIWLLLSILLGLTGCTRDSDLEKIQPESSSPQPSLISTAPVETANDPIDDSVSVDLTSPDLISIGASMEGEIIELEQRLYLVEQGDVITAVGDPERLKRQAVLSDDGTKLLYAFSDSLSANGTPLELGIYHFDTQKETVINMEDQISFEARNVEWVSDELIIVTDDDIDYSNVMALFNSETGIRTHYSPGRFLQMLPDGESILILIPPDGSTMQGAQEPLVIGVLTRSGELKTLFKEPMYETRIVDIQFSNDLTVLAMWTHIVPAGESELWTIEVDPETWTPGKQKRIQIDTDDTGTILFDEAAKIIRLSNGQQFPMP